MYICPVCAHEWTEADGAASESEGLVVRDANGNLLQDGDLLPLLKT